MGQVIAVDFAARVREASPVSLDLLDQRVSRPTQSTLAGHPGLDTADFTSANNSAGAVSAASVSGPLARPAGDQGSVSLTERCRELRAHSAALQAAMADLQTAAEDLRRLPALARELCEAAI